MSNEVFHYFKKAFVLVNKSWGILLFGLSISLLGDFSYFLEDSFISFILQITGIFIFFISFGFFFSLPVFLSDKQNGKPLNFRYIFSTTLRNTKRTILPLILLTILVFTLIISFFLVFIFIYKGDPNFMKNISQGFSMWNFLLAFFVGLLSFTYFTPIYFSLEKNGFFSSVKKSISFSIKNPSFYISLFAISAFVYLALSFFFNDYKNWYQFFLRNIIYQYEALLLAAASLIFYQNTSSKQKV